MHVIPPHKNPVDFEKHLKLLEGFLTRFKTTPEQSITTVLGGITIADDELSDEDYDFADPDDDTRSRRRRERNKKAPQEKYKVMLQEVADRQREEFVVDLDDLETWAGEEEMGLVKAIEKNTQTYAEVMSEAIDNVMPDPTIEMSYKDDAKDILMERRRKQNREAAARYEEDPAAVLTMYPPELTRRYTVLFKPRSYSSSNPTKAVAVRDILGGHLGGLITVRAIATRVSDVKPMVEVNAYTCDLCGQEIFQPVHRPQFSPMLFCPADQCNRDGKKGELVHSNRASKFTPFQEVKVQELADQVPIGQIPRTLTVSCYGPVVRKINPGDVVDISGIYLPAESTGFRALRAGLSTDVYLEAHHILQHKKAYSDIAVDPKLIRRIEQYRKAGQVYEIVAKSIAPEIFGHLDVKKALLLLLVGGCEKEMGDGMKIRGDINICLMGDPGVAKSQLLKYITKVAPRGVYTSGRGSSGVGLTAAVMRDPVTDDMVLEGGALVLADNGICCIDEFDKMDENDRTAIHEVMEQQTISISKAGISTTLNARTSILAAANPLYGRYNPRLSPVENINLPAALLSRFDVMFLLLDTPTRETDAQLAKHVTYVHMNRHHPEVAKDAVVFTPDEVRSYVATARTYRPVVTPAINEYLAKTYVRMREQQDRAEKQGRQFTHTTARTLLGVVRLAQALARLRFSQEVVQEDVDEAIRLVEVSKESLQSEFGGRRGAMNASSKIYNLVKMLGDSGQCRADDASDDDEEDEFSTVELSMRKVKERVIAKGFTEDQWLNALEEYTNLDVWHTAGNGSRLVFVASREDSADPNTDD